jgi:hypothetical protein
MRWRRHCVGMWWFVCLLASSMALCSGAEQPRTDLEWQRRLLELRRRLGTAEAGDAEKAIQAIADPKAVPALNGMLLREPDAKIRKILLEPLVRMGGEGAKQVLLRHSVLDDNPAVRIAAQEHLIARYSVPELVREYARLLAFPDPIRSGSAENLSKLKDPSAIEPLIDALVTARPEIRSEVLPEVVRHSRGYDRSFDRIRQHYQYIPPRTRYWRVRVPETNASVLEALKTLTGRDYGYDEQAWKKWWKEQKASPTRPSPSP